MESIRCHFLIPQLRLGSPLTSKHSCGQAEPWGPWNVNSLA